MPDTRAALDILTTYGYPGLFIIMFQASIGVGVPIPVTVLLLTLGALSTAQGGGLDFALTAAIAIPAICAGHTVDYLVGRAGNSVLERLLNRLIRRAGVESLLARMMSLRGGRTALVLLSRFLLTPIACPVSLLAGMTRMKAAQYALIEVAGVTLYVLGNMMLGRIFGAGLIEQGGAVPAFWGAALLLMLVPFLLVRYLPRVLAWLGIGGRQAADAVSEPPPSTEFSSSPTPQP